MGHSINSTTHEVVETVTRVREGERDRKGTIKLLLLLLDLTTRKDDETDRTDPPHWDFEPHPQEEEQGGRSLYGHFKESKK